MDSPRPRVVGQVSGQQWAQCCSVPLRGHSAASRPNQTLLPWAARCWGPDRRYPVWPVWSSHSFRSEGCTGFPSPSGGCCQRAGEGVNAFPRRRALHGRKPGSGSMCSQSFVWGQENLVEGPPGVVSQHQSSSPSTSPDAPCSLTDCVLLPPLSACSIQLHWHPLPPVFGVLPFSPAGFSLQPQYPGSLGPLLSSELWRLRMGLSRGLACE